MLMGYLLYKRNFPLGLCHGRWFCSHVVLCLVGNSRFPTLGLSVEQWPKPNGWTWILLGYAFSRVGATGVEPSTGQRLPQFVVALFGFACDVREVFFLLGPDVCSAGHSNASARRAADLCRLCLSLSHAARQVGSIHSFHREPRPSRSIVKLTHDSWLMVEMIGESLLGLLAVLACTAGFESDVAWNNAYADWATIQAGLANKLGAFIQGCSPVHRCVGG